MEDRLLRDLSGAAYMSGKDRDAIAQENELSMLTNKGELSAYKSKKEKKIYVAHRGTDKMRDLSADVAIGLGLEKYHPRFKRARREVARIQDENPGYEIIHTGHSLGGSLAQHTGKHAGGRVVTFNKGAGVGSLFRRRGKNQTDYVNIYDPVSLLSMKQKGGTVHKQKKIKGHAHKIESSSSQRLR
jgi:hypothetical protein